MKKNVLGIFILLVAIFVITAVINPKFLNAYNMQNLIKWSSLYAVMSLGVAFVITRVGESSRIIFCGDTKQDDLAINRNKADISGLGEFMNVLSDIPSFKTIKFTVDDIVRSGLVKEYIIAKEKMMEAA